MSLLHIFLVFLTLRIIGLPDGGFSAIGATGDLPDTLKYKMAFIARIYHGAPPVKLKDM